MDLFIGDYQILGKGKLKEYNSQKVSDYIQSKMNGKYLREDTVRIELNLNSGKAKGLAWGCDLSKQYVAINSEYTT